MQYTIRNVPPAVDRALRKRARAAGASLNDAILAVLREGVGVDAPRTKRRDLGDLAGRWPKDAALDEVLAEQRRVDEDLWR